MPTIAVGKKLATKRMVPENWNKIVKKGKIQVNQPCSILIKANHHNTLVINSFTP